MVQRCSVYGCRSNSDATNDSIPIFSLPSNETLRKIWLQHIPFDPTIKHNPVICLKHFEETAIIRSVETMLVNGEVTVIQRERPKLKSTAVPTIFPLRHLYGRSNSTPTLRHQPYKDILYNRNWQGGSVVLGQASAGVSSTTIDLPPNPATAGSLITNQALRGPAAMTGFLPVADQSRSRNNQFFNMYGFQTSKMMAMSTPGTNQAVPVPHYPEVRFKKLAFYDTIAELLKPSALSVNSPSREYASNFVFFLTPSQASQISMNREVGPGTRNEYVVQVQMRFCPIEGNGIEQDDGFPPGVQVKVNTKFVTIPQTNGPLANKAIDKRPHKPLNISPLVKLCPSVANNVTITWNPDFQRGYIVGVNLVKKLNSNELLERLKNKVIRNAELTRNIIKDKLSESDGDIATTILMISLLCPLGKIRMNTACRAATCSHLQCFDGSVFLSMNEKRPTWTCPVCNRSAVYESLVIDQYFQEVLDSPKLDSECKEIQLNKDGSWSTADQNQNSTSTNPDGPSIDSLAFSVDSPKQEPVEEIDDEDDEVMGVVTTNGDKHTSSSESKNGPPKKEEKDKDMVVVDLTTDDDEEESRLALPQAASNDYPQPPPSTTPSLPKTDYSISDTSSSLSTARSPSTSIITIDSPSPSPPLNYIRPPSQPSSYVCQVRLSDNRYHPY